MGRITITIDAASLEEAQEMMRVKAPTQNISVDMASPEGFQFSGLSMGEVLQKAVDKEAVSGLDPEHSSIPKPTAPTEQPATEPSASTAKDPEDTEITPDAAFSTSGAPSAVAPATSTGVELDADGLPWDSRIHSSSRKKLAKTQRWKKARGVDADLVVQVEAELRQAMAIPSPKLETPATTVGEQVSPSASAVTAVEPAAAPATELTPPTPSRSAFAESDAAAAFGIPGPSTTRLDPPPPAQESEVPKPAEAPQPDATIVETTATPATTATAPSASAPAQTGNAPKTLAELNALVLGAGMQLADVLPAVQEVGLASYALLGTRPDLIPEVARKLGLGLGG